jgi:Tfp pilus assembly protein PilO
VTDARRILVEKKRLLVPLGVVLALNVVLYGAAVYPLTLKVASAEQRAEAAALGRKIAEQRHQLARDTVASKQRADEELARFYSEVLPADLTGARRIAYLRLAQLAQQADLKYERRTVSPDQDREGDLARLHMTMVVAGAYADVRRFIYQLETAPEFVVIENVEVAQNEESGGTLKLTLTAATYYRASDHAQ